MTESDARFVAGVLRKERVFSVVMKIGVAVGAALMGLAIWRGVSGEPWGATFVIAIMVLLNARLNLRQCRYARVLRELTADGSLLDAEAGDDR